MAKFTYQITLNAGSSQEAENKMKAITVLASRLTEKELGKLADIIQNDPIKTMMAKKALGV